MQPGRFLDLPEDMEPRTEPSRGANGRHLAVSRAPSTLLLYTPRLMDDVSIRPARIPADLDQLSALYAEEVRWHTEQWPDDFRVSETAGPSLEEQLSSAEADPSACLLVAEVDHALVGLVSAHLQERPAGGMVRYDGPVAYIGDLVVTGEYRRRGIGALLMEHLELWARRQGAVTVTLYVHDRNHGARALYDRQGFRAVHVQMRKDLQADAETDTP